MSHFRNALFLLSLVGCQRSEYTAEISVWLHGTEFEGAAVTLTLADNAEFKDPDTIDLTIYCGDLDTTCVGNAEDLWTTHNPNIYGQINLAYESDQVEEWTDEGDAIVNPTPTGEEIDGCDLSMIDDRLLINLKVFDGDGDVAYPQFLAQDFDVYGSIGACVAYRNLDQTIWYPIEQWETP